MFYSQIDPVLTRLGGFEIRYYGLVYALSFLLLYLFLDYLSKNKKIGIAQEKVSDLVVYLILGVILGARTFYIIFYNLEFYLANPAEIIMLWHGGMSFHGGLIGAAVSAFAFCKKNRMPFYEIADAVSIPAAAFLMLGRIGNFVNGELYGRVSEVPWAVKFQGAEGFRHPSQIYESFKNLIIFSVLWFEKDKKRKPGYLFWLFVMLFGALRFIIEFFRMPDSQIGFVLGDFSIGQLLSFPMFVLGAIMVFIVSNPKKRRH